MTLQQLHQWHVLPSLVLAPMEGVIDAPMRQLFSERGSWGYLVSEFIRVTQNVPTEKVFLRHVPELLNGGRTPAGHAVHVQLLGGDAQKMAEAAVFACKMGALGIDINFGCPAPTVNRHDGGATLLKYPDRIYQIVKTVRDSVPANISVSAKLRLGWDTIDAIHKNADAAAEGGANWLTIHGRTRMQGYAPPAHWEPIGQVKRRLNIPIIANGDIWSLDDFKKCQEVTGCKNFMVGRGILADPFLQREISGELGLQKTESRNSGSHQLSDWLPLLKRFAEICKNLNPENHEHYTLHRMKQWLRIVSLRNPDCDWFERIRRTQTLEQAFTALEAAELSI